MKAMIKRTLPLVAGVLAASTSCVLTSCEDFFEQDSEYIIYEEDHTLNSAADTIYSVTGILDKLQNLADRTILLGEARADLVDVTNATSEDLRQVALFNVDSDNKYNNPTDYYTVINNCNYFIANADTALRDGRNNQVFIKEYAAIKAYRAWTYLQLVLNYGQVPFVTEPILTKEQADADYPIYDLKRVCNWLIQDITPYAEVARPGYGDIRNTDSRFFYFPIYILLGDLNLWAGNYKEAAMNYYKYISTRNGMNSTYATSTTGVFRYGTAGVWNSYFMSYSYPSCFTSESYGTNSELITMIPGDSIPSEGNYSELRNIFNNINLSTSGLTSNISGTLSVNKENNGYVSLTPSPAYKELSYAQRYCHITSDKDTLVAPTTVEEDYRGDLRMSFSVVNGNGSYVVLNGEKIDAQWIRKHSTRNVHIYRRMMVYLRMAEALNRAGYPRFAYQILASGVNNEVIKEKVIPYYRADSLFLSQFDFPNSRYVIRTAEGFYAGYTTPEENTMGIHSRGSGWSEANPYYQMPYNNAITDSLEQIAYQVEQVEDMIVDEGALECAFEGTRYYDLMRVALRRGDASYLANRVYGRKGAGNEAATRAEIKANLEDMQSWYLDWDGQIGINVGTVEE